MKKLNRKICVVSAIVLVTAATAGCMGNRAQPRTQNVPRTNMQTPPAPLDNRPRTSAVDNAPMRDAKNIADALVGKHNIRRANVFVTDSTAYVAVDIPNLAQGQLTDAIKNAVADEVRRVDPSIKQVYVSADPDVFTRFQQYGNDIRAGRPIAGIFDQFTEMVRRVFPQRK